MTMVTCAKCGKRFNRGPAQIKKNKRGKFFCSRECLDTYESKDLIGNYGGRMKRGNTVRWVVKNLTPNKAYHIDEIRVMCQKAPGKRDMTRIETSRLLLAYCDDMESVGKCQWKRVAV